MAKVNIYLPDALATEVKALGINISAVCQRALREENELIGAMKNREDMERIEVECGDHVEAFTGHWLVVPEPWETRAPVDDGRGWDAGTYYGVALTKRGRIAVYTAHCNNGFPAMLTTYDTLNEIAQVIPANIFAQAKAEMIGEPVVIERDI
jgi:hypothetical protein